MNLAEKEIQRIDWNSIRCGCGGSASHVADGLLRVLRGGRRGVSSLDGHLFAPSVIYESAVRAVDVSLAVLAEDLPAPTRMTFAEILLFILSAEGQSAEAVHDGRDLLAECQSAVISGSWLLYSEVMTGSHVGTSSYCFEILTLIDDIEDKTARLEDVRQIAGERLSPDLRTPGAGLLSIGMRPRCQRSGAHEYASGVDLPDPVEVVGRRLRRSGGARRPRRAM